MVKIQNVDPAKLTPADYNPRTISEHQAEALKRSLDRWGFVEPIVANKRTGHIVGGHQRLDGALALALPSVPVHWIDVDESSEKALNIALNKISGDWDEDLLGKLLADLERDGQDLEDLGFDADELQEIIDAATPEPELSGDLDAIPEPPAEPITQPGDLWQLGEHRLLCGDSTNAEDVARLMGGAKADAVVTDPPYGMNFQSNHRSEAHRPIDGDSTTQLLCWVAGLKADHSVYAWCRWDNLADVPKPKSLVTWVKNNWSMGDLEHEHGRQTEVCLFYPGPKHRWPNGRPSDVIYHNRTGNPEHPTQKPVSLMEEVIGWTKGFIFDPFVGSGTTIIAAEQAGRRCFAMELSPAYCDVAVKRWEQATGRKAERIG